MPMFHTLCPNRLPVMGKVDTLTVKTACYNPASADVRQVASTVLVTQVGSTYVIPARWLRDSGVVDRGRFRNVPSSLELIPVAPSIR